MVEPRGTGWGRQAPLRTVAAVVLLAWAGRNVALQGPARVGPTAPPPPGTASAAAATVDPLQGVLAGLAGRLGSTADVVVVAPAGDASTAFYWSSYFLYPRPVRPAATPAGAVGLVVVGRDATPGPRPGYDLVAQAQTGDHWYAAYVRSGTPRPGGTPR